MTAPDTAPAEGRDERVTVPVIVAALAAYNAHRTSGWAGDAMGKALTAALAIIPPSPAPAVDGELVKELVKALKICDTALAIIYAPYENGRAQKKLAQEAISAILARAEAQPETPAARYKRVMRELNESKDSAEARPAPVRTDGARALPPSPAPAVDGGHERSWDDGYAEGHAEGYSRAVADHEDKLRVARIEKVVPAVEGELVEALRNITDQYSSLLSLQVYGSSGCPEQDDEDVKSARAALARAAEKVAVDAMVREVKEYQAGGGAPGWKTWPELKAEALARAGAKPLSAEGWRLVPVEATLGMVAAGLDAHEGEHIDGTPTGLADVWSAMLAAAPSPPQPVSAEPALEFWNIRGTTMHVGLDGEVTFPDGRVGDHAPVSAPAGLVEALNYIAKQKLTSEMDDVEQESADFEGGYDHIIEMSRAALSPHRKGRAMSDDLVDLIRRLRDPKYDCAEEAADEIERLQIALKRVIDGREAWIEEAARQTNIRREAADAIARLTAECDRAREEREVGRQVRMEECEYLRAEAVRIAAERDEAREYGKEARIRENAALGRIEHKDMRIAEVEAENIRLTERVKELEAALEAAEEYDPRPDCNPWKV